MFGRVLFSLSIFLGVVLLVGCGSEEDVDVNVFLAEEEPVWSAVARDYGAEVYASVKEQAVYLFVQRVAFGYRGAISVDESAGFSLRIGSAESEVATLFPGRTIDHTIAIDFVDGDEFGYSVVLDRRNELLLIGAPGADNGAGALYAVRVQGLYHGEYVRHSVHRIDAQHLSFSFGVECGDRIGHNLHLREGVYPTRHLTFFHNDQVFSVPTWRLLEMPELSLP